MKIDYTTEYYITDVEGVECSGLKDGKNGLGIVKCSGKVVGVFTSNKVKAAPVILTKDNISDGKIEGIVVNSGNANAFTGEEGLKNAEKMAELVAERIGCRLEDVAVSSTGVIGVQLDMNWITSAIERVYKKLGKDKKNAEDFAKSITTTDSFPKMWGIKVDDYIIAGVAKGAGMISPNMATMLAYIFTDAKIEIEEMQNILKEAVSCSFNSTIVDGDTSTNDTVLFVSTCKKSKKNSSFKKIKEAVKCVCTKLAEMIAIDGEGSTKLMKVFVKGAKSVEDAEKAARAVASSILVKTALFGCDPNWGRIVAALGYSNAEMSEKISLTVKGYPTIDDYWQNKNEQKCQILTKSKVEKKNLKKAKKILENCKAIEYVIDLHSGNFEGYAIGCDLSHDYVKLNSEYTT